MSSVALSPTSTPIQWQPERLRTEQHEWGVAIDPKAERVTERGRQVQEWINEDRAKGWGQVLEFHSLRLRFAARVFDADQMRHDDPFWYVVDGTICDLLNRPRNGLVVVPVNRCGTCE